MTIDRDDPRLTAYALGQLEGVERDEFEALLALDEPARREVEEIRAVAHVVREARQGQRNPGRNAQLEKEIAMRLSDSTPEQVKSEEDRTPERHAEEQAAPAGAAMAGGEKEGAKKEGLFDAAPAQSSRARGAARSPVRRRWFWSVAAAAACVLVVAGVWIKMNSLASRDASVSRATHQASPGSPDFDALVDLITTTVAPQSWQQASGKGSIREFESNLAMTVTDGVPPSSWEDASGSRGPLNGYFMQPLDEEELVRRDRARSVNTPPSGNNSAHSVLGDLRTAEHSHIPTPDEPPITYPSREEWEQLQRRRGGGQDGNEITTGLERGGTFRADLDVPSDRQIEDFFRTRSNFWEDGRDGTDLGKRPDDPRRPATPALRPASNNLGDAYITGEGSRSQGAREGDRSGGGKRGGGQSAAKGRDKAGERDPEHTLNKPNSDTKPQDEGASKAPAKTWRRSQLVPNASRLMVGETEELPLTGMQANVAIDGFRARVVLDLYYFNDRAQQLEGNFDIRLPNESSLYFFAFGQAVYKSEQEGKPRRDPVFFSVERSRELASDPKEIMLARSDTWLDPKEARMVPRETASFAYRETVRRRVDPALVEWAGAGMFNAKVFPLAPHQLHRIVIGYDVNLMQVDGDLVYRLDLPEGLPQSVVDVKVSGGAELAVQPEAKPMADGDRRTLRFTNPKDKSIELRLKNAGSALLHGRDETGNYFAARFQPALEAEKEVKTLRPGIFLVDTSLSANPDRFNVYLKLLRSLLDNNRETMPQFAVMFFNVESHWWQAGLTDNTEKNVEALMEYCQKLSLEGATDLQQAIRSATRPDWPTREEIPPCDYFLLSDGSTTWGQADFRRMADDLRTAGPLFAYSTGYSGDDTQALAFLARESGGAHFTLVGEDQLEKISKAHRQRPWQVLGVSIEGGSDLILAGRPTSIFPGQTLLLVGRGKPADGSEIALKLSRAGEETVLKTRIASAVESDLAARLYGQVAVGGLEELVPDTRDFAVAYARHFRITGATCSLLMLDTEEDYKRFNIKPEEDAFVVASTPAGKVIEGAAAKADERRRERRAAFVAWLERMEKMPGTNFQVSPALRVAIQSLPDEAFAVQPGELHCKLRLWSDLPAKFQDEGLAAQPLSYDAISSEAARRFQAAGADDALKAISSLVELSPGDTVLARDVAFSAMEWGRADQAYSLFRRVATWRPYEPHSYHGLARSLTAMGNYDLALLHYELAVTAQWDGRFGDFQKIVGLDYLRFLRSIEQSQVKTSLADFAKARRQSIEEKYGIGQPDVVITMAWNTDGTDVDMHVIEPTGEECYYSHRQTRIGGDLSQDVTQGFGPEMYVLRKAVPGAYQVRAHYFASDANRASTRTRVHVTIVRDWGTKQETATTKTVTLSGNKDVHDVARIVVE